MGGRKSTGKVGALLMLGLSDDALFEETETVYIFRLEWLLAMGTLSSLILLCTIFLNNKNYLL